VGGGSGLSCVGDAGGVSGNPPGGVGGEVGWELIPLAVGERSDIGRNDGCGGVCGDHHLEGESVMVAEVERCVVSLAVVMSECMTSNLSECGSAELVDVCSYK